MVTPEAPAQIWFVCTGNVCRSAYAEAALRQRLGPDAVVGVESAGTQAMIGRGMDETMATAAISKGLQNTSHRAKQLCPKGLEEACLVFVFSPEHRQWVAENCPEVLPRTLSLGQTHAALATLPEGERISISQLADAVQSVRPESEEADWIPDPYKLGLDAALTAVARISAALDTFLARVVLEEAAVLA
ncbi:hypothetical protein EII34_05220 [Arachnia propionica]|uniref:Phosphotyrosine protein phosphatase I domain-containing protein n=1 Tax=Arachnia propionica TaxID=1750 RepID=A0A3P1TA67_9ACTN|nr:hypothetical protein [Arachnia propionica]MDO5084490.1 hypothetical protein [Arachnia propionica]RRD06085.1 hypothetical protein EII34_05220 [Arachnia propionica]